VAMMRCCLFSPALLLFFVLPLACSRTWANPIVVMHPAYMSAERLEVKVGDEAAEIDGRFHFVSTAGKDHPGLTAVVPFEVWIWVPAEAKQADARTAGLLQTCVPNKWNELSDANRALWEEAVGMKISMGKHEVMVEGFSLYDAGANRRARYVEDAVLRKGFFCLRAHVHFPPAWLKGDPEIRVRYRQGLRLAKTGGEFFYVPMFDGMPAKKTTLDLKRYAMHVSDGSAGSLSLGTVSVPAGSAAVLPLLHHVPVGMMVERRR
jgi:hypothetical protein